MEGGARDRNQAPVESDPDGHEPPASVIGRGSP